MRGARLVYLYVGSADVEADLPVYLGLGGELVWRVESGGVEVAAVRLGEGPLVLLADHRPAPSSIQIWAVDDLDGEIERLRAAGWTGPLHTVEGPGRAVPGPVRPERERAGSPGAGSPRRHGTPRTEPWITAFLARFYRTVELLDRVSSPYKSSFLTRDGRKGE